MAFSLPKDFKIDVHTHLVPDFYREALIDAGNTTSNGELVMDGFITPKVDLDAYMKNREKHNIGYSVLSITAPGCTFLNGNSKAKRLARRLNDELQRSVERYPGQIGALGCLPLPDIDASLAEIKVCQLI